MIGQQLRDRVTITSSIAGAERPEDMTVPAHVYTISGNNPREPDRLYLMVSVLRAIIAPTPRPIDPVSDTVTHQGTAYRIDGPPLGRYRNGRIHHWTLNLERTE